MQKIAPCLWFDGKAAQAMHFYTSIFKHSKVGNVTRYGEAGPGEKGSVMTATFEIEGQQFTALNGVSWQIVPTILSEMLQDKDAAKIRRVMQAMLAMIKLDIKALQQAYERSDK